jgi:putative transposase
MRKFSKKRSKVKEVDQKKLVERVVGEESLLSLAMAGYAARVLQDAVDRMKEKIAGIQSWGVEEGYVRSGLTRVPIERPRLRGENGDIEIPEYKKLQSRKEFDEGVRRAIMGGLASRQFERVGEALGSEKGLSKSTISRVSKSFAEDFKKLMTADCANIVAALIDGIYITDELCVIAVLGVNRFGGKRLLGLWAGSTEGAELMKSVMRDLQERNLNPKIFVIDGSKALRAAIEKFFPWVPVQRCQVHKRRNVAAHVGKKHEAWAQLQMTKIFKAETLAEALSIGKHFAAELEKINVTASRSWLEAFPETITVLQMRDTELRRVLATTNAIESLFSSVRSITGRVKRWRTATQALSWIAAGYFRIQPQMRKIRGFRSLNELDTIKDLREEAKGKEVAA